MTQLPGYIAYLLKLPPVPEELRNARTGIVSFHNAELVSLITSISSESAFLDAVDRLLFEQSSQYTKAGFWKGTGNELEALLFSLAGYSVGEKRILERIFCFNGAGGTLLNRLSKSKELNRVIRGTVRGSHIYTISTDRKYVPCLGALAAIYASEKAEKCE